MAEYVKVLLILAIAVVLYISEAFSIDVTAVIVLLALAITKVLTVPEALSGFSDPAVITIAGFFVMSAALYNTGVVEAVGKRLIRIGGGGKNRFLLVMMVVAALIASFMSNVVTTAVLMPAVIAIAKRLKQPASQFLMPLAYGAILGGKCTLVGSSTNLAINGLLPKYNLAPFTLFEFIPIGVPVLIVGVVYMIFIGTHLLPKRGGEEAADDQQRKKFVTEVVIAPNSPLKGRTLGETDFHGTYDLQVLGIVRGGAQQLPHKDSVLQVSDVLLVKGKLDQILSIKDAQGLLIKADKESPEKRRTEGETAIVEAILSQNSVFANKTLKQIRFANRYGADVLGIYRHGESLHEKLSDIYLRFGDVLVIQGTPRRIESLRQDSNFLTLDEVDHTRLRKRKAIWAVTIFIAAAIIAGFNIVSIPIVALSAAVAMILTRCISVQEAYAKVAWSAIVLIAASIPLGVAMEKTGAAKFLADYVTRYFGFGGPIVVMGAFFLFTALLTQPMANAACALMIAPIAINVANQLHVNPRSYAIAIAIAASCSFPTPLEPVTAIVYGPGKYKFADYVGVGGIMTILAMIVTLLVVPMFWPFH